MIIPNAEGTFSIEDLRGSSLSVTQLEEVGAEWGGDAERKSVDDDQGGEGAKDEHPEPEEDVDLLVEDVNRQDAEGIVLLQLPRGPKLVKCTLCQPSFDGFHYRQLEEGFKGGHLGKM